MAAEISTSQLYQLYPHITILWDKYHHTPTPFIVSNILKALHCFKRLSLFSNKSTIIVTCPEADTGREHCTADFLSH